ncbi:MAG: hypothetical protein L6Q54_04675 [Leptospiraceae bacterium]|nr:hypothetical protein [Leptospiraceae bacterium]MCK6380530.1 hypothetical protein [Leptospiraceae bacterium]NUM42712.1 hypothetical protein [Leptospiraceae bacterium]
MFTKEEAKKNIKKLAEDFSDRIDYIKNSGQYKEAQIEDEFIKPLFKYPKIYPTKESKIRQKENILFKLVAEAYKPLI